MVICEIKIKILDLSEENSWVNIYESILGLFEFSSIYVVLMLIKKKPKSDHLEECSMIYWFHLAAE